MPYSRGHPGYKLTKREPPPATVVLSYGRCQEALERNKILLRVFGFFEEKIIVKELGAVKDDLGGVGTGADAAEGLRGSRNRFRSSNLVKRLPYTNS